MATEASDNPDQFRIAVLASGEGSNLQVLIDQIHGRVATVACVGSDKPGCKALERAAAKNIETGVFAAVDFDDNRKARDAELAGWLQERNVNLIVLAGYMQLLSPEFVAAFRSKIINVHPALLPSFPGLRAIEQAIEHHVRVTGVTVHIVDEGVDSGPIIMQEALALGVNPDLTDVTNQLQAIEHRLLPQAVEGFATGELRVDHLTGLVVGR